MKTSEMVLDLSLLPHNARRELLDFYEFLTQKYERPAEMPAASPFVSFLRTPIQVQNWIPYTREELHER